jgi:hypothetical protein
MTWHCRNTATTATPRCTAEKRERDGSGLKTGFREWRSAAVTRAYLVSRNRILFAIVSKTACSWLGSEANTASPEI